MLCPSRHSSPPLDVPSLPLLSSPLTGFAANAALTTSQPTRLPHGARPQGAPHHHHLRPNQSTTISQQLCSVSHISPPLPHRLCSGCSTHHGSAHLPHGARPENPLRHHHLRHDHPRAPAARGPFQACLHIPRPHRRPIHLRLCSPPALDLGNIEPGNTVTVKWRGKPVFIRRRTPADVAKANDVNLAELRDPEPDSARAPNPEWLVVIGVCTHLGCVPLPNAGDYGGWFCPCHGSHYDISGRIRKGPAPTNLEVPTYKFLDETKVLVG
ncbi:unnamed protein product [Closterium sp. NIES-53]